MAEYLSLLQSLGIDQADVLGYSFGSAVALQMALRHPELVRKLVFADREGRIAPKSVSIFENAPCRSTSGTPPLPWIS